MFFLTTLQASADTLFKTSVEIGEVRITHTIHTHKSYLVVDLLKDSLFLQGIGATLVAGFTMLGLEYTAAELCHANINSLPFSIFKIVCATSAATLFSHYTKVYTYPNKYLSYICGLLVGGLIIAPLAQ